MSDTESPLAGLSVGELWEKYDIERRLMSPEDVQEYGEYFLWVIVNAISTASAHVIEATWPKGLSKMYLPMFLDTLRSEEFLLSLVIAQ